ncbi:MAG: hypothetical protein K2I23_01495 [Clostridia bacterium]|nr:hypothetical protein [Clostridia bacterium]
MKRKKSFIILTVLIVAIIAASSIVGCSINGFRQEDFQLAITDVRINDNIVTIDVEFKNTSWRNGLVVSGFNIIEVIYQDEDNSINWGFPSIAVYHWIRCKQKITETQEFQLEKGIYTITAIVDFFCNGDRDSFYYRVETIVEV